MNNITISLRVFRGALIGGLAFIVGGFIVLAIIGIVFYGLLGWLTGFYFAGQLILFVGPIGMVVGAVVTVVRIVTDLTVDKSDQSENHKRQSKITYAVWIGLPLLIIGGLAIIPFTVTNVNKHVVHGATWTTEVRSDCDTPAVILMLREYPTYEIVCSAALLSFLDSQGSDVVPITYRVTYDFGEPRSYQLISAGPIEITWSEWLGGPNGCGAEYLPPCDSPQAKKGSPLYESSWSDK